MKSIDRIGFVVICFILCVSMSLLPVVLYIYKFGIGLWDESSKWAELGTFFGGVLGPLLSFFSVILLLMTVYLTGKSLTKSQENFTLQLHSIKKQDFDSLFFNQLKMVIEHIRSAFLEVAGTSKNVDTLLASDFHRLIKSGDDFDPLVYLPYLSQATESFDQLVVLLEDYAPNEINKLMYRHIVKSNLSVHFRWFVGKVWENTHPEDIKHRDFLEKNYGVIKFSEIHKNNVFETKF